MGYQKSVESFSMVALKALDFAKDRMKDPKDFNKHYEECIEAFCKK